MKYLNKLSLLLLSLSLFTTSCKKDDDDDDDIDLCEAVVCQNGGTCDDGQCDCADGYEGDNCETEVRAKYFGDYAMVAMAEDCEDITVFGQTIDPGTIIPATDDYTLAVTADPDDINGLILTNSDDPDAFTAVASVNVSGALSIISQDVGEQDVQGNIVTISAEGSGSFTETSIQLNLTKTRAVEIPVVGAQTATCTQTQDGTK